jgi:hypothetical protein
MSTLSKPAQRWRAWAERHAADRWRTTLALVRSVGANIDREREAVSPSLTRTVYIGGALLAMESLTPSERQAFIERYADLHGEPAKPTKGEPS